MEHDFQLLRVAKELISLRKLVQYHDFSPSIKLQFLLLCLHAFLTEVEGRSC